MDATQTDLPLGAPAPDFALPSGTGETLRLSDLRGQRVVLFAYGADGTSACTAEIRDFQSLAADFAALGVRLLGVSKDSVEKHAKFATKEGLTLTLLSDKGGAMMEGWNAYGRKIFFGKEVVGVLRTTFLIGADGRIERIWKVEKVKGHAAEVLAAVRG